MMTPQEERAYWSRVISELQQVMTVREIAELIGVIDRQVWRWKSGEDRPIGVRALEVYLLHRQRRPGAEYQSLRVTSTSVLVAS